MKRIKQSRIQSDTDFQIGLKTSQTWQGSEKGHPKTLSMSKENQNYNTQELIQNMQVFPGLNFYSHKDKEKIVQESTMDPNIMNQYSQNNYSNQDPDEQDIDENMLYMIKDLDSGKVYDQRQIQEQKQDDVFQKKYTKLHVGKHEIWTDYWKELSKDKQYLLDVCQRGDIEKLQSLFNQSVNPNFVDINARFLDRYTALHIAAQEGHLQVFEFLLENGADFKSKTTFERTVLHISCIRGHYEISKILCDSGSDVNAQDKDFNTPLHYASTYGFTKLVSYILTKRPELELRNFQQMTAEDCALNVETMQLFRSKKEQDNQDSYSRMALEGALLRNGRVDHIQRLLFLTQKKGNLSISSDADLIREKEQLDSSAAPTLVNNALEPKQEGTSHRFEKKLNQESKLTNMSQKQSKINQITIQDIKNDKVGPDDFIIKDTLGQGSFGSVYLVQLKGTQKFYAMKTLQKEQLQTKNIVKYAQTERNVLSIMNHPFIVRLNFAFQTERKLFLVMNYCPGGDLEGLLLQQGTLPQKLVQIYAAEIILALEALHQGCIIFRDLKPGNIVIDDQGHACITDFGLSKEGFTDNLQAKSFCGSLAYLAPEMLQKQGHGFSLDWYLVGVLIYQLLQGDPPFFDIQKEKLIENIKQGSYITPKNCSQDASDLISKLLIRDPDQRLGNTGAQDIKSHPWFSNINWDEVYNRKIQPPIKVQKQNLNITTQLQKLRLTVTPIEQDLDKKSNNYMSGWSFTEPSDGTQNQQNDEQQPSQLPAQKK